MDEQAFSRLEQLLQDTLEVAEENNELLHKIQRQARWSFWGKIIIWVLVLGLPLLFLGPILKSIVPYTGTAPHSVFGLPSAEQLDAVISAYQASGTEAK